MQDAVRSHPELRIIGSPTFCFCFTSDEFDIYHVNDFMRTRGWRFNGQQYPNSIHMAVTRPQTQPGVREALTADLAEAVAVRASSTRTRSPKSGAIYGGIAGGMTDEADEFIRAVMADMMDKHQGLPPRIGATELVSSLARSERPRRARRSAPRSPGTRGRFEVLAREMDALSSGTRARARTGRSARACTPRTHRS